MAAKLKGISVGVTIAWVLLGVLITLFISLLVFRLYFNRLDSVAILAQTKTSAAYLDLLPEDQINQAIEQLRRDYAGRYVYYYGSSVPGGRNHQLSVIRLDNGQLLSVGTAINYSDEASLMLKYLLIAIAFLLLVLLYNMFFLYSKRKTLEQHRRNFVANVSHELRTPLTVIQGHTALLLHKIKDAEPLKVLDTIQRETGRLNQMIDSLLMLSRLEESQLQLEKERVNGADLIYSTTILFQDKLAEKEMSLTVHCLPDLSVLVNPALAEEALMNLLSNAIRYCPPGSAITLSAFTKGTVTVIEVCDNGPGLEKKVQTRVFERFYRHNNGVRSRSEAGSGLGLAIVKHIMLAHGGRASVVSTPGQGSCFSLTFPLK